jgi:Leucine-rich repeat (LRR) protein
VIDLTRNKIEDANLSNSDFEKLNVIYLNHNKLKSVDTANSKFDSLEELNLVDNLTLTDIQFIKKFKQLKTLSSTKVNIDTIKPLLELKNLKLVTISSPELDKSNPKTKGIIKKLRKQKVDIGVY